MTTTTWQLQTPIDGVVFDCDGTLSAIEGINELAKYNNVGEEITALTEQAMSQTGLNPKLYHQRLVRIAPQAKQLIALGEAYRQNQIPDGKVVIETLKRYHKAVYLVSAGLSQALHLFGEYLNIPKNNIYAVDVHFDAAGHFIDFDHTSPLTTQLGKQMIVNQLKQIHDRIIHIGDGLNDLVTHDLVTRFIGFGGAFYRKNIEAQCHFYIRTCSLAPVLPLVLTAAEYELLNEQERIFYHKGLDAIQSGHVKCPDKDNSKA